jgi:uncharacterized membrane protein YbhN (UPF0104 family)
VTKGAGKAARIGLTIALLGLILYRVPLSDLVAALRDAADLPLLAGLALGGLFVALKVLRWGWLLRCMGVACSWAEALYSFLGGMAVGLITPGRVGEVARSLYLRTEDRGFVSGAALLDKIFDVSVIVAVGAIGCASHGLAKTAAAMGLVALGLFGAPLLPTAVLDGLTRIIPIAPVRRLAEKMTEPLKRLTALQLVTGSLQGVASFAVTMLQFQVILNAFDTPTRHPGFAATLFAFPLIVLSNLVPITLSGLGVRENVAISLLAQYRVPAAVAVNTTLLVYAANSLLPGLVGALLAPRWRTKHAAGQDASSAPARAPGAARAEEPVP